MISIVTSTNLRSQSYRSSYPVFEAPLLFQLISKERSSATQGGIKKTLLEGRSRSLIRGKHSFSKKMLESRKRNHFFPPVVGIWTTKYGKQIQLGESSGQFSLPSSLKKKKNRNKNLVIISRNCIRSNRYLLEEKIKIKLC